MIDEFRALGGTADNVFQVTGSRGRGLFPIDKTRPVCIRVPPHLLIPVEDIEFVDGRLKIKDSANVGVRERVFFERYQNVFSWGGSGRADCVAFLEGLKSLPADAAAVFDHWIETPVGDGIDVTAQRFLDSRNIDWNGTAVIAPVIEFLNHECSAASYKIANGISVEGTFPDEVLVHYGPHDPLGIFLDYGFASPESMAFSLPMQRQGPRQLIIGLDTNFGAKRGSFPVPEFKIEDDRVVLSCLVLGNSRAPRVPKAVFSSILSEAGWKNPEEEFEFILHQNRLAFLELLGMLEAEGGDFALTVRKVIRFQLRAMSFSFGSREL